MIDFSLSEEQKEIQAAVRKFVKDEVIPRAPLYDESQEFPIEIYKKSWENGFMNLCVPKEYGGLGLDSMVTTIITEEYAYGCAGIATSTVCNDLANIGIVKYGSHSQKVKYLTPFTREFKLASFCLTERMAGTDNRSMKTKLIEVGKDCFGKSIFCLSGEKCFITNGGYAGQFTVFAKDGIGITMVVIPKSEGVIIGKPENKMGQRASNTTTVTFEDVKVHEDQIIGRRKMAFRYLEGIFEYARPFVAAIGVGIAQRALDEAVKYSKERVQFGGPISRLQDVRFTLSKMEMEVHAARLATYYSIWAIYNNIPGAGKYASVAKNLGARAARFCAMNAVQIHGGYGYMKGYPVEKLLRDSILINIYEGVEAIQHELTAREFFNKE